VMDNEQELNFGHGARAIYHIWRTKAAANCPRSKLGQVCSATGFRAWTPKPGELERCSDEYSNCRQERWCRAAVQGFIRNRAM